jgi:hypothetical protein
MNDLQFTMQLRIFLAISALATSLFFLCLLFILILSLLPLSKRFTEALITLAAVLPAAIFAALILIMVDNFTYTVFKFGIVSTEGWSRALYGLGFMLVILLSYRRTVKAYSSLSRQIRIWGLEPKWILALLVGVGLLSIIGLVVLDRPLSSTHSMTGAADAKVRPHILLITADGMDASHMSVYGYARDTTPFLRKLAESSLVAENAFSNADHTTGSIISIYTGKYPARTRLFFSQNILKGVDSYQHLPGILHSQGYKTVQITVPDYLDSNKINLLDGFDEVKMSGAVHSKYLNAMSRVLPNEQALFADEIINRIVDRIRHILFIEKMNNPHLLAQTDLERWEILREEIQTTSQPIFVHIHLLVTHGKRFNPVEQNFSAGQSIQNQEPWNVDFYDDSILDVDKNIGELIDYLAYQDLLENTILIIASDHSQQWSLFKRLPFIIRFPHAQYASRIEVNVQNLDIAPTLLDYIGIDPPDWMRGNSLIAGEPGQRAIVGISAIDEPFNANNCIAVPGEDATSPFDTFLSITLIKCQRWFKLDLANISWASGIVEGSTAICPSADEITDEQAFQLIIEHLKDNDFNVSRLSHFPSPIN